jgi:hypothetical protein
LAKDLTALPVRGNTFNTLKRTCKKSSQLLIRIEKKISSGKSRCDGTTTLQICTHCWKWRCREKNSTYSLGKRTALADGNPVTLLNTESGGDVSRQVLVALLVTVVLGDVVKVFTADDNGTVHLGGDDLKQG